MSMVQREYKRQTIEKQGKVKLIQWERMGVILYAVEYPGKFGKREMQLFHTKGEADLCFYRFADFFSRQQP